MIIEKTKWLTWVTYPSCPNILWSPVKIYLQSDCKMHLPLFIRKPFPTMLVDLKKSEQELWVQYGSHARRNIRRAMKDNLATRFDQNYQPVRELFKETAAEKGLRGLDEALMQGKQAYCVSHVFAPDGRRLAAHFYDLDEEQGIARLGFNASAYRSYDEGDPNRYLCGRANRYLFHQDFLYFRNKGYAVYDFGGYERESSNPEMASVNRFKAPFNGEIVQQYNYYPLWYYLLRQVRICTRKVTSAKADN